MYKITFTKTHICTKLLFKLLYKKTTNVQKKSLYNAQTHVFVQKSVLLQMFFLHKTNCVQKLVFTFFSFLQKMYKVLLLYKNNLQKHICILEKNVKKPCYNFLLVQKKHVQKQHVQNNIYKNTYLYKTTF